VAETLRRTDEIEPVKITAHGHDANLHVAVEYAGGDSAIIEFPQGRPVVHHRRRYTLMPYDPTYDE
jgi:choloylglycine hydrolase